MTGMQWGKLARHQGLDRAGGEKELIPILRREPFIQNSSKRRQASARRRLPYTGKLLQSRIRSTAVPLLSPSGDIFPDRGKSFSKREPLTKRKTLPYCQSLPH